MQQDKQEQSLGKFISYYQEKLQIIKLQIIKLQNYKMQYKLQQEEENSQFIRNKRGYQSRPKSQTMHKTDKNKLENKYPNSTILLISLSIIIILTYFYVGGMFNFSSDQGNSFNDFAENSKIGKIDKNNMGKRPQSSNVDANINAVQSKVSMDANPQKKYPQDDIIKKLENNQRNTRLQEQTDNMNMNIEKQVPITQSQPVLNPNQEPHKLAAETVAQAPLYVLQQPKNDILATEMYPKGIKIQMKFQRYPIDLNKYIPDEKKVTAVFTSCNRYDLLDKTLTTFYKYNSYPLEEFIVVEDGHISPGLQLIMKKFQQVTWLITGKKLGQLAAIDEAYKLVKTPYVFHSEDDWEFLHSGFIEESFQYFQKLPNMIQLWIRKHGHPIDPVTRITTSDYTFSLNPGLKKMSDYEKVGNSYAKFTDNISYGKGAGAGQIILTKFYKKSGYVVAQSQIQYTKHIGQRRGLGKIFRKTPPVRPPTPTPTPTQNPIQTPILANSMPA